MSISYLCHDCAKLLGMRGIPAVNEVRRKWCEGCGGNDDNLVSVDTRKCDTEIEKWNRENES